jgi:hypothetical protein
LRDHRSDLDKTIALVRQASESSSSRLGLANRCLIQPTPSYSTPSCACILSQAPVACISLAGANVSKRPVHFLSMIDCTFLFPALRSDDVAPNLGPDLIAAYDVAGATRRHGRQIPIGRGNRNLKTFGARFENQEMDLVRGSGEHWDQDSGVSLGGNLKNWPAECVLSFVSEIIRDTGPETLEFVMPAPIEFIGFSITPNRIFSKRHPRNDPGCQLRRQIAPLRISGSPRLSA